MQLETAIRHDIAARARLPEPALTDRHADYLASLIARLPPACRQTAETLIERLAAGERAA